LGSVRVPLQSGLCAWDEVGARYSLQPACTCSCHCDLCGSCGGDAAPAGPLPSVRGCCPPLPRPCPAGAARPAGRSSTSVPASQAQLPRWKPTAAAKSACPPTAPHLQVKVLPRGVHALDALARDPDGAVALEAAAKPELPHLAGSKGGEGEGSRGAPGPAFVRRPSTNAGARHTLSAPPSRARAPAPCRRAARPGGSPQTRARTTRSCSKRSRSGTAPRERARSRRGSGAAASPSCRGPRGRLLEGRGARPRRGGVSRRGTGGGAGERAAGRLAAGRARRGRLRRGAARGGERAPVGAAGVGGAATG
jgi:hypothetical protein